MKTLALAALCAILGQCHARESTLSRPKRTLRMLESLFGSMRDTFGPLTAPSLPAAQPPTEVILATKYPIGVKYALYPTVRMHIRPVQQHVIYMQSLPALPAPMLHPARPLNTGAVEFLRPMARPMMRLPKTQTTTTIHYELIPLPVPVHSESLPPSSPSFSMPQPSSPPPPPPSLPSTSPFSYDETDDPAPWSLDELPPPVPTSAPLNPLDEPNVPWNLHALPPPVATKQPRGNEAYGWSQGSAYQHGDDASYTLPAMFDKKLVIPAQGIGTHNRQRGIFRPSPLQSEISVQPSVELAAYSQTQTLAQQPVEYVNRLRNLNSPKPQVFPNRNNRLRREAPPAHFIQQIDGASPHQKPVVEDLVPLTANSNLVHLAPPQNTDSVQSESANMGQQYASARQFAPSIGHDIRIPSSHAETSSPEQYVLITPRPIDYSRRLHPDPATVETRQASGYSQTSGSQPHSSNLLRGSILHDRPRPSQFSTFLDQTRGRLRFPPTGALSKVPRRPQQSPSLFSLPKKSVPQPLSVDNFFDDKPTKSPAARSPVDQFWRSDYENVEYFEPIIIDIGGGSSGENEDDKKRRRTDFGEPHVEFQLKNSELKKSTRREPLRLPGRLHETVDRLSKALMHPPIFDIESEANEPKAVIVLVGNGIT